MIQNPPTLCWSVARLDDNGQSGRLGPPWVHKRYPGPVLGACGVEEAQRRGDHRAAVRRASVRDSPVRDA